MCVCVCRCVKMCTMRLFHCCETDRVTSGLKFLYLSFLSNTSQMLPPAVSQPLSDQSGRVSAPPSLPPPAPCRVSEARCGGGLTSPFCSQSSWTSLLLPQLYNGERENVGCVSAVLELQRVCGYSHPEG